MKLRWSLACACLLALGCPKETPTESNPAPSSSASASAVPTTSASAPPSASAPASASPSASASSAPSASASSSAPPSASTAAAAPACGKKPLPDCPLQGWMKKNMNPPMMAKDWPAVVSALDAAAGFAPAGYTNWVSIAKDGANAARAADENGVKAACRGCHEQYKAKYRAEIRTRPIP